MVSDAFYNFIEDHKEGIFKGPYVCLKLPFELRNEKELQIQNKCFELTHK